MNSRMISIVLLAMMTGGLFFSAALADQSKAPVRPVEVPAGVSGDPMVNPLTQVAVQNGVLTCTSRINQIASFLVKNDQTGVFLFTTKDQPDRHIFSVSMEIRPAKFPAMYATASFAPTALGGCDAVYDTVEYIDEECSTVAAKNFKGQSGVIKKDIAVFNTGAVKFFSMPAGKGCVVIKKEVIQ